MPRGIRGTRQGAQRTDQLQGYAHRNCGSLLHWQRQWGIDTPPPDLQHCNPAILAATSCHSCESHACSWGPSLACARQVITHLLLHDADVDSKIERSNLITGAAFSG